MNKKKNKGTAKKVIAGLLMAVLLVGVTIMGTLAFMSTISNEKNNSFVGSKGIKLALAETKFDATAPKVYGPGDVIEKNPQLINFSEEAKQGDVNADQDEWVALMVKYSIDDIPKKYSDMQGIIKAISFNDEGNKITPDAGACWIKINNTTASTKYEIYLYNKTIQRNKNTTNGVVNQSPTEDEITNSTSGSYTEPLFEKIEIISQTEENKVGSYTTSTLPSFDIDVVGYAIKAEYTKTSNGTTTLITSYNDLSTDQQTELQGNLRTLLEAKLSDDYKAVD